MTAEPGLPSHADGELTSAELAAVARVMVAQGVTLTGPLHACLIAGGRSNLTFLIGDTTTTWVLRMPPRTGRTPSAHDVAREFRVTTALEHTDVPVARAIVLCEDEAVIGGPFTVCAYVPGHTIRTREEIQALSAPALQALTTDLVETLASLHRVDYAAVGLADLGRPDRYAERQLRRWSRQWDIVGAPHLNRLADELATRLCRHIPTQCSAGIVHGDYRIDNTIVETTALPAPRIAAVVDWELSTIGDPVADVAMMCAYRDPAFDLIVGSPSAWTSARLPDVDAIAEAYEHAGGVTLAAWDYHRALACFKIAVIAAGIDHRRNAGSGSGAGFDTAGTAVEPYLDLGLRTLRTAT